MIEIDATGKVSSIVRVTSGNDNLESDFIFSSGRYSFQVICQTRIARYLHEGDNITIVGELRENDGDVYIWADSIEPDKQMELRF